ncbi:LysR family transcriptional regulator [Vibrio alginolyticus]|uniref:LysR family transcriptional regulator n=1 Tax=Vibrio sp. B1FLJ16 TaxID=2751178 RepID=UPI0015F3F098|nr:LysR family transcriptional regulator [Vibrio sp. B1FLJ16]CAD7816880.1 COG0583 Transcriptional regulator [Vibrio sp. B1FLJ16]CAD7818070.1 COG0583 Transcriptional regulator [Vibrio sp. B1FLJ16]CAE6929519.1 COG0583 Transcriptional regulator [Vibrio sp. B1FLJ16]CAE6933221.1 COG0583 Transcriptional regulator [Vibrio sp. B1FLJ16]
MQVQDVDLRMLRIFVAIVECGGLSAAESRLNIGRSTISSHLSDLELRLGLKLCKRGRSGFEVTEAGRVTYQASLELLQQCEAFAATVATSKNELSGRVTIAIIDTLINDPRCHLAEVISALKNKSNNLQFDINVCEAREVETSVVNGRSLVGIGVSRHQLRGLDYHPLHNETNYLYCGKGHPLFDCDPAKTDTLLQQAEVITSNYTRDKETRNDELNYQNSAIAYHDEGIAHLILSGEFIGYLPEHYASSWVSKGLLKPILPEKYTYQIPVMLITLKNSSATPLANALIEEIKRCHTPEM